ncbi:uncharacterized protein A1O9_08381 [Exophiala aquamarina CBS 119918]|uniref:Uncharacterized protein n=1 Tax=Exophiala aquamarina CBS 119918 TaxID=1182545 RepID=A0A072P705_9EURO|nr:uncharacterized protein A1O9_08381 [Exophiala aquamarina CBS 119918]KEF55631.1 hypothetical protein A1O9_08381 [Exophiala aquamarina CBS 119918]
MHRLVQLPLAPIEGMTITKKHIEDSSTLPLYNVTSPQLSSPRIFSPAPAYMPISHEKAESIEPQEIMGVGLTEGDYIRRFKSRTPASAFGGPIELATLRFSAVNIFAKAEKQLLKPKQTTKAEADPKRKPEEPVERPSRLRSSPAISDLRAMALSRSPSISPARTDNLG